MSDLSEVQIDNLYRIHDSYKAGGHVIEFYDIIEKHTGVRKIDSVINDRLYWAVMDDLEQE